MPARWRAPFSSPGSGHLSTEYPSVVQHTSSSAAGFFFCLFGAEKRTGRLQSGGSLGTEAAQAATVDNDGFVERWDGGAGQAERGREREAVKAREGGEHAIGPTQGGRDAGYRVADDEFRKVAKHEQMREKLLELHLPGDGPWSLECVPELRR